MNPRFIKTALVCLMLMLMSVCAHAKAFKGLIERRAVNDPTVKSSKVINVQIQPSKFHKVKKSERNAKRPPHARTIREVKVVKLKASALPGYKDAIKGKVAKGGEK